MAMHWDDDLIDAYEFLELNLKGHVVNVANAREDVSGAESRRFTLRANDRRYVKFLLCTFPGACGILVVRGLRFIGEYTAKDKKVVARFIKEVARANEYTRLIATTSDEDDNQPGYFQDMGWQHSKRFNFHSRRTGNNITMWFDEA